MRVKMMESKQIKSLLDQLGLTEGQIQQALRQPQPISVPSNRMQTAQPYNPSLAERVSQGIGNTLYNSGIVSDRYGSNRIGQNIGSILEMLPATGDIAAADDFGRALSSGDTIGVGMGLMSAIPIVGKAFKKGIPMDQASTMERAKSMGFDTDRPLYHGTTSDFDEFNIPTDGKNGAINGYGVYFDKTPQRANIYAGKGDNGRVIKAFASGNVKEITDNPFSQKEASKITDYINTKVPEDIKNQIIGQLNIPKQTKSFSSKADAKKFYDQQIKIWNDSPSKRDRNKPTVKSTNDGFDINFVGASDDYLKGISEAQVFRALASINPALPSNAMMSAGYDGVRLSSGETIIYKPEKIRSVNAKFDPNKSNSRNMLAGAAGLGLLSLIPEKNDDEL